MAPRAMARSVLVVATSDKSPLIRMRAAYAATAVAEYFRDQGKDVLLMMDSVTRFAMAGREVGLAAGEPPTRGGYTPSVFAHLPQLLERAGKSATGSITGIYTVLVDGDDFTEPIADSTRSILDGHIVLTRELADLGHYPAIDVLRSISRLRSDITTKQAQTDGQALLRHMATFKRVEDMVNIGAYQKGANAEVDKAIAMVAPINGFLRQLVTEREPLDSAFAKLHGLVGGNEAQPQAQPKQNAPQPQARPTKPPPLKRVPPPPLVHSREKKIGVDPGPAPGRSGFRLVRISPQGFPAVPRPWPGFRRAPGGRTARRSSSLESPAASTGGSSKPAMHPLCPRRKIRAVLRRVAAQSDHMVEFHLGQIVHGLGGLDRDVHPGLAHDAHGVLVHAVPDHPGGPDPDFGVHMTGPALGHLAATGIAGAQKQNIHSRLLETVSKAAASLARSGKSDPTGLTRSDGGPVSEQSEKAALLLLPVFFRGVAVPAHKGLAHILDDSGDSADDAARRSDDTARRVKHRAAQGFGVFRQGHPGRPDRPGCLSPGWAPVPHRDRWTPCPPAPATWPPA